MKDDKANRPWWERTAARGCGVGIETALSYPSIVVGPRLRFIFRRLVGNGQWGMSGAQQLRRCDSLAYFSTGMVSRMDDLL